MSDSELGTYNKCNRIQIEEEKDKKNKHSHFQLKKFEHHEWLIFYFLFMTERRRRAAVVLYVFECTDLVHTSGIRHHRRWNKQVGATAFPCLLLVHLEYCVILLQSIAIPKVEVKFALLHTLGNFTCGGQGSDAAGGLVGYKTTLRQASLNVQTTELSPSTAGFWKAGTTSVSSLTEGQG